MLLPEPPLRTACRPPDAEGTTALQLLQQLVRLQERQLALQEQQLACWRTRDPVKLHQAVKVTSDKSPEPVNCPPVPLFRLASEPMGLDRHAAEDKTPQKLEPLKEDHFPEPPQFTSSCQDLQLDTNKQLERDATPNGLLPYKSSSQAAAPNALNPPAVACEGRVLKNHCIPSDIVVAKEFSSLSRISHAPRRARITIQHLAAPSKDFIQQLLDDRDGSMKHGWSDLGLDVHSATKASVLPSDTPQVVMVLLAIAGLLPLATFQQRRQARTLFAIYQWYVAASIWVTAFFQAFQDCVILQMNPTYFPAGILYLVVLCAFFKTWRSLCLLFDPNTGTMNMIIEMTRRGFSWKSHRRRARIYLVLAVLYATYDVSSSSFEYFVRGGTECQMAASSSEDYLFAELCVVMFPFPTFIKIQNDFAFFAAMWLLPTLCAFHTHEMVWYSGILGSSLESDDDGLIYVVTQAEKIVTARLRSASTSWVSAAFAFFLAGGLWIATAMMYVFLGLQTLNVRLAFAIVLYGGILVVGILPFAQVAEAYEHEVFRRMNLTEYCKKAQPYYGQQFLMHLRTLDWGFRVGGVTINMPFFSRLVTALALGLISTLLRSGMSRLS
eukprot:TRINITY_DN12254_c0_g2_i1.p1 TRINITY_DN12254_c0_g2~~TRINITY_DN12254_c0_g2_i1.p1  ORF type:complete len:609 (-),score=59.33 TRINITY_DN12254_c0_g2_i1:81-1907(-)